MYTVIVHNIRLLIVICMTFTTTNEKAEPPWYFNTHKTGKFYQKRFALFLKSDNNLVAEDLQDNNVILAVSMHCYLLISNCSTLSGHR